MAVQIQSSILNVISARDGSSAFDTNNMPKIKKSCRSFKEVAEVALSQLEFLLQRNYLKSPDDLIKSPQSKISTMRETRGPDDLELHNIQN